MAAQVEIKWNGKQIEGDIKEGIQKGILAGAHLVRSRAVLNAPEITGNLRRSINVSTELENNVFGSEQSSETKTLNPEPLEGFVGTIVRYAAKIERTSTAFLGPAFSGSVKQIEKFISEEINKVTK